MYFVIVYNRYYCICSRPHMSVRVNGKKREQNNFTKSRSARQKIAKQDCWGLRYFIAVLQCIKYYIRLTITSTRPSVSPQTYCRQTPNKHTHTHHKPPFTQSALCCADWWDMRSTTFARSLMSSLVIARCCFIIPKRTRERSIQTTISMLDVADDDDDGDSPSPRFGVAHRMPYIYRIRVSSHRRPRLYNFQINNENNINLADRKEKYFIMLVIECATHTQWWGAILYANIGIYTQCGIL